MSGAIARVLVIGGYGNFGGYVARRLAGDTNIQLLIGGRSQAKADAAAARLGAVNPAEGVALDIGGDLAARLAEIAPDIVLHTTGPFQAQDHRVARAAIAARAHYIDLADARDFVASIGALDAEAKAAGVAVIAGASSVPCLTAAILDAYRPRFARLARVEYGISAAQQTNRGLGTAAAILSYVGQPFTQLRGGRQRRVFGWQGLRARRYPELGTRLFGYCDIPDLALFPARYPELENLSFVAGHEIKLLHLGTWALSWLVRFRLIRSLAPYAGRLLRLSFWFDPLGSGRSGFHMTMRGTGIDGAPLEHRYHIIARSAHGPNIPCIPLILLARKLARGEGIAPGARPCLDLLDLDTLIAALRGLDISIYANGAETRLDRPARA